MNTVLNINKVDNLKQPMFLGESLGIQRYDRPKYPKFIDLFIIQKAFQWMPAEINLNKDKNDYANLTPEEKFIFNSNLRFQTMTDSMLSRSIHKVKQYVSNSELEICMNTWAAMEDVHSFSYTYILQNIHPNATEFFNSILEDEAIVKRANDIKSAYDRLLGEPSDIKQQIFDCVLSTNITEGLAFYVSFACSFYFGYRGKMVGNADNIKLIARDEAQHVAITQTIIKNWTEYSSEGFQEIVKANKQKVYDMYGLAAENEKKWAQYLFSNGTLMGLNADLLSGYVEWLTNGRLTSLGYDRIFDVKKNPIAGWLDAYTENKGTQVAPQETEKTEYRIGAQNTNINKDAYKDIDL